MFHNTVLLFSATADLSGLHNYEQKRVHALLRLLMESHKVYNLAFRSHWTSLLSTRCRDILPFGLGNIFNVFQTHFLKVTYGPLITGELKRYN
jgi:hypothetical protein